MNNFKSRLNTENGIEITSVGQYLEKIKEISEDADGFTLFFRGQQTEYWDIQSSIFRESKLNIEHKLMKLPKSKLPLEFSNNCDAFDLMTKFIFKIWIYIFCLYYVNFRFIQKMFVIFFKIWRLIASSI